MAKGYFNGFEVFRFGMNRICVTDINYVGTIYRMKMLIELAEINQVFVFKKQELQYEGTAAPALFYKY